MTAPPDPLADLPAGDRPSQALPHPSASAPSGRPSQTPLFVERQTYRRRRLVDAARALPVLGVMLWWLPLLWTQSDDPMPASTALLYIFVVWIVLSLISAGLVAALGRRRNRPADTGAGTGA